MAFSFIRHIAQMLYRGFTFAYQPVWAGSTEGSMWMRLFCDKNPPDCGLAKLLLLDRHVDLSYGSWFLITLETTFLCP